MAQRRKKKRSNADEEKAGPFENFAAATARFAGRPVAFLGAAAFIAVWAISGPLFGFSDTWQLVVNTSTTIITFLMVFLIQHTQNRDTLALQIKLAELVLRMKGADNDLAVAEGHSIEYLEKLHRELRDSAVPGKPNGRGHPAKGHPA